MQWWEAIVLGIVEGLTEFLPVSSTAHLLVVQQFLGIDQLDVFFLVVVQLAAMLAVLHEYRVKLLKDRFLWKYMLVSFLPFGLIAFVVKDAFAVWAVDTKLIAWAMILGGIVFVVVEALVKQRKIRLRATQLDLKTAFLVGIFQALALIPGVSRSGAIIIGMLVLRYKREKAVEYSFLLGLPTIAAATVYELYSQFVSGSTIATFDWTLTLLASFTAFVVALSVIRLFLRFVARSTFTAFGFYRVLFGLLLLFTISGA